jgi:hypothetical protein
VAVNDRGGGRETTRTAAAQKIQITAPTKTQHPHPNRADRRRHPVIARSVAYRPGAGRRYWLHLVIACPFECGVVHHHRGAAAGGLRRAHCGRGTYLLRPAARRQTAGAA